MIALDTNILARFYVDDPHDPEAARQRFLEYSIDRVEEVSYIKINKGDKRLLEQFNKRNNCSAWKAVGSFALITAHAIACSYIGTVIFSRLKQALTRRCTRRRVSCLVHAPGSRRE